MISVADALAHISALRPTAGTQTVALSEAMGRILAQPITAGLTQPPLAASAMDGYAVKLADVSKSGAALHVIGEAPAGTPFTDQITTGQAVRIFTGGAIPKGTDTVIIQENVTRAGETITVNEPQSEPRHIRKAGIDFTKGEILIPAGTRIGPAETLVAAAANHAQVTVQKRLKVAILSNGDELCEVGDTPKAGQIISSNPHGLAALITAWGGEPHILPTARDSIESIMSSLALASDADIIVPVGGASVGDHDYMRAAFTEAGLEMVFEKIAVRPGKPTWCGAIGSQTVLGLPGNPASAIVCAHIFLQPLLQTVQPPAAAKLKNPLPKNGPRESYLRAVASLDAQGQLWVEALPKQDSGLMTPFLKANALLRIAAGQEAKAVGDTTQIIWLTEMQLS